LSVLDVFIFLRWLQAYRPIVDADIVNQAGEESVSIKSQPSTNIETTGRMYYTYNTSINSDLYAIYV